MKKLALILAALLAVSLLVSCSGTKAPAETAEQTEQKLPTLKAAADVSLAPLASALAESAVLGENTEYLTMGDEYAEDTLMFTYGVEEFRTMNVANYLVSEHGSNEAYTCAVLLFGDDYGQSVFETLEERFDTYSEELFNSVAPYSPEAAALCNDHLIRVLDINGANGAVHAVCLFISDDNTALEKLVSDQLNAILAAD